MYSNSVNMHCDLLSNRWLHHLATVSLLFLLQSQLAPVEDLPSSPSSPSERSANYPFEHLYRPPQCPASLIPQFDDPPETAISHSTSSLAPQIEESSSSLLGSLHDQEIMASMSSNLRILLQYFAEVEEASRRLDDLETFDPFYYN